MKNWVRLMGISLLLLVVVVAIAACGGNNEAQEETEQQGVQQQEQQQAKPTEWEGQADWDKLVAAAKSEGKLIVSGPTSDLWRNSLLTFQEEYPEITIEYTGGNSRDFWPRVKTERELGKYLWDLRIGGPDPQVFAAKDDGTLDPVRPLLVLPEVIDDSKWLGGLDAAFADTEKQFLFGFNGMEEHPANVNRDVIPASELATAEQLIDPKWKGKIAISDPTGGAGLGHATILMEGYGEEFITKFLRDQEVVVTKDIRQLAEWLVRGTYPIAIGARAVELKTFKESGLQFNVEGLKGPVGLSIGSGGIQLLNKAPHQNAAKLFINWVLTAEAQEKIAVATEGNSRRLDVKQGNPDIVLKPENMQSYIAHQEEHMLESRKKVSDLAHSFIK